METGIDIEWDQETSDCAAMAAERNLPEAFVDQASGPTIANALRQLTHVKLDREKISSLGKLCYILSLPSLTHLFLQQNGLKGLSGIELAKGLKFLDVSGNQLSDLHGLFSLTHLMVLDASDNAISRIDAAELPTSLSFLNVEGNPCCTSQESLREYLRTALPNLKELDGDPLTDYSCSDCSTDSESETEDEDDKRIEGTCRDKDELEDRAGTEEVFEPDEVNNCKEESVLNKASRGSSRADTHIEGKFTRSSTASDKCIQPPMPEVIERLGTPASVSRVLASSTLPHPDEALDTALDADMVEFYQLKDSLCESNLDAEGALHTVLSHTIGGLDYGCNMMIKRAHERMKNLHVQMGQEIVEMFFAPRISEKLTPKSMDVNEQFL